MKNFISKIILAISIYVIPILLIIGIGYSFTKTENFYKIDKSVHKIIVGDSHPACSLNDSIITNSINLASSGEAYFYSLIKIKKIIQENPQIDTVILGYSYHNLSNELDEQWFSKTPHLIQKFPSFFPLFTYKEVKYLFDINSSAVIKANFHLMKRMFIVIWEGLFKQNTFENLAIGGQILLTNNNIEQDIVKIRAKRDTTQYKRAKIQEKYLKKISNYCIKENITLILINPPIHKVLENTFKEGKDDYFSFYHKFLHKHKLLNYADVNIPNIAFADAGHLNCEGAVLFSEMIKDSL